ncbi:MAG: signal peptidase I [Gammaproteobacteria bacterium CG22_combo_CG10-13_8_21_14_all_40_8]|nr:MAG: signal peptidase I [Gammaproteobacteria bacterium CG22_combo_CG10-13_8_21_14_all_40_8]
MKKKLLQLWKENQSILFFLCLMFIFRSAVADWNTVPTGSMKPTIEEGDRILVNKMAYDLRVPFTHIPIINLAEPLRGDIVTFDSEALDKTLVKRVVGIPGDVIEMRNNMLWINGNKMTYSPIQSGAHKPSNTDYIDVVENLSGVEHAIRLHPQSPSPRSSFLTLQVPKDSIFVMGDNRDNSADSRYIGLIPRREIVGQAKTVVMSLDYDDYYLPRKERFWHTL